MSQEEIRNFFINFMEREKKQKVLNFKFLNKNVKKGQILFVGSSLMEQFPINEMQHTLNLDKIIYNRGIGGTVTQDLLDSMDESIYQLEPSKIFINIGTNDLSFMDYKLENLISNYNEILTGISEKLPMAKVYVMAYYPVNAKADFSGVDRFRKIEMFSTRTNETIKEANSAVERLAEQHGFEFINVNQGLVDENGDLKQELSVEGVHMLPSAYEIVLENIKKYLL